jgi:hypothetical protein
MTPMGKRSNFPRRERDDYPTPWPAVAPLLTLLEPGTRFVEPCAGGGELIRHLERAGHTCVAAYDLPIDARTASYAIEPDTIFVTNLPWRPRFGMKEMIANLSDQRPLWALLYSDWLFTLSATPYLPRLRAVAVVGRVRWIPHTKHAGFENCCWCLFDRPRPNALAAIHLHGHIGSSRAGGNAVDAPLCPEAAP